ncbi:hypothetical protein GCM10022199_01490 [Marihabitans asiaticum]|uniref:BNR repeat protein n=1 Tax=Marihabitans asiaticum TaxID=415218 RepID=A0A560WGH7_9MICO|nr:hypothetical protein [Marihabitans asiaticum]TWD16574.1 hypothetical protein FB557_0099 [Marihabitans asiaticum]
MARIDEVVVLADDATGLQTGTVCEPSLGASSTALLVTGNWFASVSRDDGRTWELLDPFRVFPSDPSLFCCDQLADYLVPERRWVWLLQYQPVRGENILRLAVSDRGDPSGWHWWDIAPADLDPAWGGLWFDYPDLALSDKHLYLSVNLFDIRGIWRRAVVIRWPRRELRRSAPLRRMHWSTTETGSLRFAQGSTDTMWFASNDARTSQLLLFAWPDDDERVQSWRLPVAGWNPTSYDSAGPAGERWLERCDDRITGGWAAGDRLGFAWTSGILPGRPHPFVRCVVLDEQGLGLVAEPDLWSVNGAWAYPATAPNRRGRVGMSVMFAGPTHPAHAVATLAEDQSTWQSALSGVSTDPPRGGVWGDYLTCRPHVRRPTAWRAMGYLLDGGSDRRNVEPRVVTFTA